MLTQKTRHGLSDLTRQGKDLLGTDKLETGKILDFASQFVFNPEQAGSYYTSLGLSFLPWSLFHNYSYLFVGLSV